MASPKKFGRSRVPSVVTAAIAAMAMTGGVGFVTAPAPAHAEPNYPSWNDVQKAKKSEAATQTEVSRITELVQGLQVSADAASRESKIKAEAYLVTKDALDAVTQKAATLQKQADEARSAAEVSRMRAGLLSAHLAKTGGHDLSLNLMLKGGESTEADDLLYQLGTMSKLSAQSETIYGDATRDKNTAQSLTDQAEAARVQRVTLADEARVKLQAAQSASDAASAALDIQVQKSTTMIEQLAVLKNSTVELERAYLDAEAARRAATVAPPADLPSVTPSAPGRPPATTTPGTTPATTPGTTPTTTPATVPPATAPAGTAPPAATPPKATAPPKATTAPKPPVVSKPDPTPPKPTEPDPGVGQPNGSAVDSAISFARAQLGEPYVFAGAGPNEWDCSGLTMRAYEAAGIYIGSHSATAQYLTLKGQGKVVPFSERQRGDLIWWSSNGNTSGIYHVAIYLGNGRVLEAPDVGKPVREYYIWGMGEVFGYAGRPSA